MSMPLINKITQTSKERPSEWTLRTVKDRIIYVKFQNGKLTCRYDSKYMGPYLYDKQLKNKHLQSFMELAEMLEITRFKLNHEELIPSDSKSQAG